MSKSFKVMWRGLSLISVALQSYDKSQVYGAMKKLGTETKVQLGLESKILYLSVSDSSPKKAVEIANAYIDCSNKRTYLADWLKSPQDVVV